MHFVLFSSILENQRDCMQLSLILWVWYFSLFGALIAVENRFLSLFSDWYHFLPAAYQLEVFVFSLFGISLRCRGYYFSDLSVFFELICCSIDKIRVNSHKKDQDRTFSCYKKS